MKSTKRIEHNILVTDEDGETIDASYVEYRDKTSEELMAEMTPEELEKVKLRQRKNVIEQQREIFANQLADKYIGGYHSYDYVCQTVWLDGSYDADELIEYANALKEIEKQLNEYDIVNNNTIKD